MVKQQDGDENRPLRLVHTNIQITDPIFCVRPIFYNNEKIGRKEGKFLSLHPIFELL
jgi:hypothetical protein